MKSAKPEALFEGPQTPAEVEVMDALGLGWLSPRELNHAYIEKCLVLDAIRELAQEHDLGKLPDDDLGQKLMAIFGLES